MVAPASRGEMTAIKWWREITILGNYFFVITYQRMLTAADDYVQNVKCKIIALDTEKRPLAGRVIKKQITLFAETFVLSAILFVVLSNRATDSTLTVLLR